LGQISRANLVEAYAQLLSLAFSNLLSTRFAAHSNSGGRTLSADHPLVNLEYLQDAFAYPKSLLLIEGRFSGLLRLSDPSTLLLNRTTRLG
jgi:hypothetical protein